MNTKEKNKTRKLFSAKHTRMRETKGGGSEQNSHLSCCEQGLEPFHIAPLRVPATALERQRDRQREAHNQADRQTDRQTGRQTDRLTDRRTDRQRDAQTGRELSLIHI